MSIHCPGALSQSEVLRLAPGALCGPVAARPARLQAGVRVASTVRDGAVYSQQTRKPQQLGRLCSSAKAILRTEPNSRCCKKSCSASVNLAKRALVCSVTANFDKRSADRFYGSDIKVLRLTTFPQKYYTNENKTGYPIALFESLMKQKLKKVQGKTNVLGSEIQTEWYDYTHKMMYWLCLIC